MNQELFQEAVSQGTLTVDQAFDYVLNRRDITPNAKTNIKSMMNAVTKNPNYDGDALFLDVQKSEDFVTLFSEEAPNAPKKGRWQVLQNFETYLMRGFNSIDYTGYKHIADKQGEKGLASGFGFLGKQYRGKDPMRGTISSNEMDKIYSDVFKNEIYRDEQGNTFYKGAKGKPVPVSRDTLDYLIYEKYTGQRLESNIGEDGIKLSDISVIESPDGTVRVEIAEKVSVNKTRPQVIYEGSFAQFLKQKYENKMAALPQGSNVGPDMVDLFGDATPDSVTNLWKDHFKPRLEAKFRAQLPASAGGNHKSLRKIVSRQLVSEFGYPFDLVKSWMGHAGAGINARGDITVENYTGQVTDPRLGGLVNSLVETEAANLKADNVNALFVDKGIPLQSSVIYPTPETQVVFGRTDTTSVVPMTETAREALEFKNLENVAQSKVNLVKLEKELIQQLRDYTPLTTEEHRAIFDRQFEKARLTKIFKAEKRAEAAATSAADFNKLTDGAAGMFASPETDKNLISKILSGVDTSKLQSNIVAAAGAAYTGIKTMPSGIADPLISLGEGLLGRGTQPSPPIDGGTYASAVTDPYDIAEMKGAKFARDVGIPESLGKLGAVAGEMVTGAVADPEGAGRSAAQMASLLGMAPRINFQQAADAPAPNIPNPAPPAPDMAAQGFVPVPEARANAMRGETTAMDQAPSFLYGGVVR